MSFLRPWQREANPQGLTAPPPATPVQSFLMVHAYRWGVEGEGLMRASLGKKATDSLCSYPSSAFFNAF